jgi:dTMP kinase
MSAPGAFISFEGGEGAGKSTAARALAAWLQQSGREVVLTREPGGTPGAEAIRALLRDPATALTPLADTLLHVAARADHVTTLIRPALARGAIVITDRFQDSTMAYQAFGLGVDRRTIDLLSSLIGLQPDLTFILRLDAATARRRLETRGDAADRYDLLGSDFMARVAAGFDDIAAAEPDRCVTIDAAQSPAAVLTAVRDILRERLGVP